MGFSIIIVRRAERAIGRRGLLSLLLCLRMVLSLCL